MTEVRRFQANLTMDVQAENEILMGDMDNSQDSLLRFYVQNKTSHPPQEEMFNLEATMAKLRRVQAQHLKLNSWRRFTHLHKRSQILKVKWMN